MNRELYERQHLFQLKYLQHRIEQGLPIDQVSMVRELVLALHREADELLDEVPWKSHRGSELLEDVVRSNVIEEAVDCVKIVLALMERFGVSYDEFVTEFEVKTMVVEDRWRQEHEPLGDKIALIDLDGVLNEYPKPFLDYVAQNDGGQWDSLQRFQDEQPELNLIMKHNYRLSGIKRTLPEKPDSLFATSLLAAAGYSIVIMSQRPASKYGRIKGDTLLWLNKHRVPFSRLFFVDDKQRRLLFAQLRPRIVFAVDDDPNNVDKLRDLGIKTYLLGGEPGQIGQVKSMLDIEEVEEAAQQYKLGEKVS